jgi:hypothetical protein
MIMKSRVLKNIHDYRGQNHIPRAELWLGKNIFATKHVEDNLKGHLQVREDLGMDILFLPVSESGRNHSDMDYRTFGPDELRDAFKISRLPVGVIIDGPFERLIQFNGLMPSLVDVKNNDKQFSEDFRLEAQSVRDLIAQCLEMKGHIVVIADDLAHHQSTYMSPEDFKRFIFPLYTEIVRKIHNAGAYAFFHSCGNISGYIPLLVECGYDGLAGCQGQCIDLLATIEKYGDQLIICSGIEADILESESLTESQKTDFQERVHSLSRSGGFILTSSCGLVSEGSLDRLRMLYELADGYKNKSGPMLSKS